MKRNSLAAALALAFAAAGVTVPASAEADQAPRVATDIPPVHSLVATVMQGRGAPALAAQPGASPHGFSLRPSQAEAIASADVLIWIGPRLAPWFGEAAASLAPEAQSLPLMAAPRTVLLPMRSAAVFGGDDHDHGHGHGGDHHGDGSPGHGHGHGHDGDDHGDGSHGHGQGQGHGRSHGHGHAHDDGVDAFDEHVWLDPRNGAVWLGVIAEALAAVDPAGADLYRANAAAGEARLVALEAELEARLAPVRDRPFVVFHDAYQYFEARFGLAAVGAVSMSDARAPGAARVSAIRARLVEADTACVFSEPQFSPRLAATVIEGTDARSGVLDPLGSTLEPGPELYSTLLRGLADSLVDCLGAD